jgi:hypothetical protein
MIFMGTNPSPPNFRSGNGTDMSDNSEPKKLRHTVYLVAKTGMSREQAVSLVDLHGVDFETLEAEAAKLVVDANQQQATSG